MTPTIDRFDTWADGQLERIRDHRVPAKVFQAASQVGDFSVIWHVAGAVRALGGGPRLRQAATLSVLLGAESLIVNQGVKRLFRRVRPTETGDPRFPQRRPSTSSFPSGHASSAAFAATLLTGWDGLAWLPLWGSLAAVVGTSRAVVRIHHASDVVGGALLGAALGQAARAALRATSLA